MDSHPARLLTRPRIALAAVALGLLTTACFSDESVPGNVPAPGEGAPPAGQPPAPDADNAAEYPEKPPHQLCTADLQDFLAHGVKIEEMEQKIEHGIELGVTSLPLLATKDEIAQLREQGIPQELIDTWSKPTEGAAAAPSAPVAGEPPAPEAAPPAPEGATP